MKILLTAVTLCSIILLMEAAGAGVSNAIQEKVSQFQWEATQCFGYYSLVAGCAEASAQPDLANETTKIADSLKPIIFKSGNIAGLNNQAMLGRIQMVLDSMKADMSDSCVNLAALYLKYAMRCKLLVENPDIQLRAILGGQN